MSLRSVLFTAVLAAPLLLAACGESPKPPVEATSAPASAAVDALATSTTEITAPLTGAAKTYDGKIVHQPAGAGGKDDGWFLIKEGKRRWISDGAWLEKNGYQPADVVEISAEDFQSIPEDPAPLAP